jgi:hypothetical protein
VFIDGGHRERAACCAVMNSLPFDWQARRFVETDVTYFILELLTVPAFTDAAYGELVTLGAACRARMSGSPRWRRAVGSSRDTRGR